MQHTWKCTFKHLWFHLMSVIFFTCYLSLQWQQHSLVLLLFIITWRVNINRLLLSFLDMSLKYTMQFKCAFLSLYFCILKYFLIRKCLQFQLLVSNWFRKIHQMVPFSLFNCEFSTRKKWKKIQMSDVCCVLWRFESYSFNSCSNFAIRFSLHRYKRFAFVRMLCNKHCAE